MSEAVTMGRVLDDQIRERVFVRRDGFVSRDVDAIMSFYAPEGFTAFDLMPPCEFLGGKMRRRGWTEFYAAFDGPLGLDVADLLIYAHGEVARVHQVAVLGRVGLEHPRHRGTHRLRGAGPGRTNVLRVLFLRPESRRRIKYWETEAKLAVATFRTELVRWRDRSGRSAMLIRELTPKSVEFRGLWKLDEVVGHLGEGVKTILHHDGTAVSLHCESLSPAAAPLQYDPDHRHRERHPRTSPRSSLRLEKAQWQGECSLLATPNL